ncbi:MAG: SlyX family protein [Pseudomonadota bacterium]
MSDDRFIELESRMAFQEESIQSLSQSLRHQQQIIDELLLTIEELRQRLKTVSASPLDGDVAEPPPPHY